MRENQRTAEPRLSLYNVFWTFFLVSILGYVFELTHHFLYTGNFVNYQGLIYGPFSQVYGIGAVIAVLFYPKMHNKNIFFVYVFCVFGAGIFEYTASLAQEIFFGGTSWNYSFMKYNLQGRISLEYTLIWGIFGVLFIKLLYPKLSRLLDRIQNKRLLLITWIVFVLMIADAFLTAMAIRRQYERYNKIPATNNLQVFLDKKYPDSYLKTLTPEPNFK